MESRDLFGNFHYCSNCHKPMTLSYEEDCCPACKDQLLFRDVKDYIRSHDVNEYNVADHFNIPIQKVRGWIREGRIQYKDERLSQSIVLYCQICNAPIPFGSLCTKCAQSRNRAGQAAFTFKDVEGNMRFLNNND